MNLKLLAGGTLLCSSIASVCGSVKLFKSVIPRQHEIKVDLSEFADLEKWKEYKQIITLRKEWLLSQNIEDVYINSRDNLKLHATYLPASENSDCIVITSHGYTSCGTSDFAGLSYFYNQKGIDCLITDHRAHGKSEGDYIGFGILDRFDCLEWIRYVMNKFPNKKIILHGISMGGATVLMTSGFKDFPKAVKCIIADCAFTSPYDIFAHILKRDYKLPAFPVMNITSAICEKKAGYGFDDYSTLTAMKNAKCPILFIHGAEDKFVPVVMSRKNYAVCQSPKELLIVENAGHGASYYENQNLYETAVSDFIEKWLG